MLLPFPPSSSLSLCTPGNNLLLIQLCIGYLEIKDMSDVLESVWEARTKWYNIGLKLGIAPDTLDSIESTSQNPDKCITTMIKNWLRDGKPKPTWKAIDEALRSPMVGYGQLADKLTIKM